MEWYQSIDIHRWKSAEKIALLFRPFERHYTRWIVPLTLECRIVFFILPRCSFLLILNAREHDIVGNVNPQLALNKKKVMSYSIRVTPQFWLATVIECAVLGHIVPCIAFFPQQFASSHMFIALLYESKYIVPVCIFSLIRFAEKFCTVSATFFKTCRLYIS